jgi:hypothetical protein
LAAVLRCVLQHQPSPFRLADQDINPVKLLLAMPAAQHISPADYVSLLMVPLLKAQMCYISLLCKQPAAQALEAEHVYELLDSYLQQRVVYRAPWVKWFHYLGLICCWTCRQHRS